MQASSRPVHSTQQAVHARLAELVHRHANSDFRKPPAAYSLAALARLYAVWDRRAPLVLDAGCGTGASTLALARLHPDCLVIGVDQSQVRLAAGARGAGAAPPGNALLLRADVVDIWLLLARERLRLAHHYLLYPNPWPKPAQVMRRWPAHPAFPALLQLGGVLECRSNWPVYVEEFGAAVHALTGRTALCETFVPDGSLSPFERKYRDSGHTLHRAVVDLDAGRAPDAGPAPAGPQA